MYLQSMSHLKKVRRIIVESLKLVRDHRSDACPQLRCIVLHRGEARQLRVHVLDQLLEETTPLREKKKMR